MDSTKDRFFAPCPRGLEGMLAEELNALGVDTAAPAAGGVGFTGTMEQCYRVNLHSRIASRVQWQIARGKYGTEQDLYDAACAVPWRNYFDPRHTIKVKVSAQHCSLNSLDFVTLRIKDAVCDHFRANGRQRPAIDTRRPDIRIDAFLTDKDFTLYLDTSGEPLFKRGLRRGRTEAPLRENLAAGILRLAGWNPEHTLLDPMCGSGTILIEAALMALNIPPGRGRAFAFEKLSHYDRNMWMQIQHAGRDQERRNPPARIIGCDHHLPVVQLAAAGLREAGLANIVHLKQADILSIDPPSDTGILVTNPPYGVRMGERARLASWYPLLGDALKQHFAGWTAYLLTGDLRLPKLIGLAPSRRTPLFNGGIECRLFEFRLVTGSLRGRHRILGRAGAPGAER
ncbi:MAG: THUMP domain-containing class I SAM-dependent RNA methyltransferase [Nitrospiraceae bacterium]